MLYYSLAITFCDFATANKTDAAFLSRGLRLLFSGLGA